MLFPFLWRLYHQFHSEKQSEAGLPSYINAIFFKKYWVPKYLYTTWFLFWRRQTFIRGSMQNCCLSFLLVLIIFLFPLFIMGLKRLRSLGSGGNQELLVGDSNLLTERMLYFHNVIKILSYSLILQMMKKQNLRGLLTCPIIHIMLL